MTIFAPSSAEEIPEMNGDRAVDVGSDGDSFSQDAPPAIRQQDRRRLKARLVERGDGSLCVLAVGKMAPNSLRALEQMGIERYESRSMTYACSRPIRT